MGEFVKLVLVVWRRRVALVRVRLLGRELEARPDRGGPQTRQVLLDWPSGTVFEICGPIHMRTRFSTPWGGQSHGVRRADRAIELETKRVFPSSTQAL